MQPDASTESITPQQAARMFVTPHRRSAAEIGQTPPFASAFTVMLGIETVAAWRWGQGVPVLLVHGWEANHADMAGFIEPLLLAGYSPVALDLPAHGQSSGIVAPIPLMANAVLALSAVTGRLHGIIAHSIGSAVAATALSAGLQAGRAVLIATPVSYRGQMNKHAEALGFDAAGRQAMEDAAAELGAAFPAIDLRVIAPARHEPVLFIHSQDDRRISFADARAVAAYWPGAEFLEVDGLGHNRILRDPGVIDAAVGFMAGPGNADAV
jgi:pimeloyl-ACP methyl ester carboxylesterase